MSGICGILRLDGAPPDGIEALTDALSQRGPDGTHQHRDGPCALGHTLLATTPEAAFETLPMQHPETGCTITSDLRLNNRANLIDTLGLRQQIGDAEIVLQAWLRWGAECVTHLDGEFAFAIWDPRMQRLFCARDPMGVRQLIYCHIPGKTLAFASAPSTVQLAPDVPGQINEPRIADFLEDALECFDLASTFYAETFRLPPGHCLSVDSGGLRLRRYFTLEPVPDLRLGSDEAYAEAFRDVLGAAVDDRLRAPPGAVGSMLSGGMDSGAIVALAAHSLAQQGRGRFPTFSASGPDPTACAETAAIAAAITMPNLDPHVLSWADLGPLRDQVIALRAQSEEPFEWVQGLVRATYGAAQNAGIKVLLDGALGDVVLASGSYMPRLLRSGQLGLFWREAKGSRDFWGEHEDTELRQLYLAARQAFAPDWMRSFREKARSRLRKHPIDSLVGPDFAREVRLLERYDQMQSRYPSRRCGVQEQRIRSIQALHVKTGMERYDRLAASHGIERRDPYLDLRVVRFCMSLPENQLMRDGYAKYVQRTAVAGLLPDSVRWRKGKTHLGPDYARALRATSPQDCAPGNTHSEKINQLVDRYMDSGRHRTRHKLSDDEIDTVSALRDWLFLNAKRLS